MDSYYVHNLHYTLNPQQRVYIADEVDAEIAELQSQIYSLEGEAETAFRAEQELKRCQDVEIVELKKKYLHSIDTIVILINKLEKSDE